MIKVGDTLPAATLMEYVEVEGNGCSIGPNPVDVAKATAGKTIALFALPGAYTPTCSAKHVPGYVEQYDALKAAGVDEIWCVSVNDAFVMGAWGKSANCGDKVLMLADGNATYIEENLTPNAFRTLRLNLMAFIRPDGSVLWGRGFDLARNTWRPLPEDLTPWLQPGGLLVTHTGATSMVPEPINAPASMVVRNLFTPS